MPRFIGVDLAWKSDINPTGAAVLEGDESGADFLAVAEPLPSLAAVKDFIKAHASDSAAIAIDAPLVIANAQGMRPCERAVGQRYGGRDASCHASNLRGYPAAPSVQLASWLAREGFSHWPTATSQRTMAEVYPHAGMVALFDLPKVIKYKKGKIASRCAGLRELQEWIRQLDTDDARLRMNPALRTILDRNPASLAGQKRKEYEDSLDAIFCAYLAYYMWRFRERCEVFGDVASGYIVNPRLRPGFRRSPRE